MESENESEGEENMVTTATQSDHLQLGDGRTFKIEITPSKELTEQDLEQT